MSISIGTGFSNPCAYPVSSGSKSMLGFSIEPEIFGSVIMTYKVHYVI